MEKITEATFEQVRQAVDYVEALTKACAVKDQKVRTRLFWERLRGIVVEGE